MLKFLVEHGADVNIKTESGRTALSYASQQVIHLIHIIL